MGVPWHAHGRYIQQDDAAFYRITSIAVMQFDYLCYSYLYKIPVTPMFSCTFSVINTRRGKRWGSDFGPLCFLISKPKLYGTFWQVVQLTGQWLRTFHCQMQFLISLQQSGILCVFLMKLTLFSSFCTCCRLDKLIWALTFSSVYSSADDIFSRGLESHIANVSSITAGV